MAKQNEIDKWAVELDPEPFGLSVVTSCYWKDL